MIKWEKGEITTEPIAIIAADDPVTCAIYARASKGLPNNSRNWSAWLTKPSSIPFTLTLSTSMDTRFPKVMSMQQDSMLRPVIPNGTMPLPFRWPNFFVNMTLSRIAATEEILQRDSRRFTLILYLIVNMMVDIRHGWLQMVT
jgi:hypothetical protein